MTSGEAPLRVEFELSADDVKVGAKTTPSGSFTAARATAASWIAIGGGALLVAMFAFSMMEGIPGSVRLLIILTAVAGLVAWAVMSDRLSRKRVDAFVDVQPPDIDDLMRIGRHTVVIDRGGIEVTTPYKLFRIPAMRFDHVERSAEAVRLCFQPANVVVIPASAFASTPQAEAFAHRAATLLIEGMEATGTTFVQSLLAYAPVACPSCKYNLLAVAGERCPECGTALTVDSLVAGRSIRPGRFGA